MDELANIKQKVKRELSDFLGVDAEDVEDETSLREDLHMDPTSLTDFMAILDKAGFETDGIDLTQIETFDELTDAISAHV